MGNDMHSVSKFAGAILAALLVSAPALADPLLEQAPVPNPAAVPNVGADSAYDDFSLGQDAAITGITWWEPSYVNSAGDFRIVFTHSVNGSLPDMASPFYTATVHATGTTSGYLLEYHADLPVTAMLGAASDWWIGVQDVTPGAFSYWAQATGAPSPGVLAPGISEYGRGTIGLAAMDLAWALDGSYVATTPSVPEPATWAVFVLGLGAVGLGTRRRRQSGLRVA